MWCQNPANTRVALDSGPTQLGLKWKFQTGHQVESSPAVAYGKVYVGSNDHNLYCLDAQSGTLKWKYLTNNKVQSSPAVLDGKVYTGPEDGNIYCLDAETGSLKWKTEVSDLYYAWLGQGAWQPRSSPCVTNGKLYVGHVDGNVFCIDITDGSPIWKTALPKSILSSPAVVNGYCYIGCEDSHLYKLNAETGEQIWKFDTSFGFTRPPERIHVRDRPGLITSPCVPPPYDTIYQFATWGWYQAINDIGDNATSKWKFWVNNFRGWAGTTQSCAGGTYAYNDGKVWFNNDNCVWCCNAETGDRIWPEFKKAPSPNPGYPQEVSAMPISNTPEDLDYGFLNFNSDSSATYADGKIYIGSESHSVYCFDANTGLKKSWYETDANVHSSPSIAYGNLYVGSNDWYVYCFDNSGTPRALGWPSPDRPTSSITASLSSASDEIMEYDWVAIEGTVIPVPIQHGRCQVNVKFTHESGYTWTANRMSDTGTGDYRISYHPMWEGSWTAKAFWYGDTFLQGAEAPEISFTVIAPPSPSAPPPPPTVFSITYIYAILSIAVIAVIAIAYLLLKRK
jgi:outer membrane protein assembly factor BamB